MDDLMHDLQLRMLSTSKMRKWVALCVLLPAPASGKRRLRVGLAPVDLPPWSTCARSVCSSSAAYVDGFFVKYYAELGRIGGYDIEFVPITDPGYLTDFTGTTERWLDAGRIDVAWDVNVSSQRFLYTQPMHMFKNLGFVRRTPLDASMWQAFEPFKPELWAMMLASVVYGAAVLLTLKRLDSPRPCRGPRDAVATCADRLYHAAAALLGGDEYEHARLGRMARLYRLGLLFLVLTFSATYTANLAAFLTKPKFTLHGPRNSQELKLARACLRWPQFAEVHAAFVGSVVLPPPEVAPYRTAQVNATHNVQDWSRAALQEGACDVIVEVAPMALSEQLQHCGTMHLADLGMSISNVVSVLRPNDTALARELSAHVYALQLQPQYRSILEQTLAIGASCDGQLEADVNQKIGAWEMGGVFVVFGISGLLAIAFTWAKPLDPPCDEKPPDEEETAGGQQLRTKLDLVLAKLAVLEGAVASSAAPGKGAGVVQFGQLGAQLAVAGQSSALA
jgi:hypothetical protein